MSEYVRVAAGTPLTDEDHAQLRALAQMPDSEIDFSDIPERIYPEAATILPLEEHTITLRVDAEVAEWLEKAARDDANRINQLLRREANRRTQSRRAGQDMLTKAS